MKKVLLRSIPYICALLVGAGIYIISGSVQGSLQDLLINVSASFLSIPLLLLFYELVKSLIDRNLNREITEYSKALVDREILGTLNQLSKLVYPLERHDFTLKGISAFLNLKKDAVETEIKRNTYLGFQVFKNWVVTDQAIKDLLSNSYVCQKMDNDQLISLINILKDLKALEQVQKSEALYIETPEVGKGFKVQKGQDLNPSNTNLPYRHLLLRHLEEDKYQVYDFGDFHTYNEDKLLKLYKVNDRAIAILSDIVFNLIDSVRRWVRLSGNEIIIDQDIFRMRPKSAARQF